MRDILVMTGDDVRRALVRIAHEILEKNQGADDLILIGVLRKGAPLAVRLAQLITQIEGVEVPVGQIDISLYRDDYRTRPLAGVGATSLPVDVTDKRVVLVDEVIFTGRTIRAAISAVVDLGRPKNIQLAVLVDRGHRELPIRPDYIGKNLPTSRHEFVEVHVTEIHGEDAVRIVKQEDETGVD